MRYVRRTAQNNNRTNSNDLWTNILKKLMEVLLSNVMNNNQKRSGENTNVKNSDRYDRPQRMNKIKEESEKDHEEVEPEEETENLSKSSDEKDDLAAPCNNDSQQESAGCQGTVINEYEQVLASFSKKGIAELIKEVYHGVIVTVTLINGQIITGEVIGLYNNILILRSAGILNYIKGEAIMSFS